MFTFARTAQWLLNALGIDGSETSRSLSEVTTGVIDIMQGGWSQAQWDVRNQIQNASLALATVTLVPVTPAAIQLVLGFSCRHTAGVATTLTEVNLKDSANSLNSLRIFGFNFPPDTRASSWGPLDATKFSPVMSVPYFVVPPGWKVDINYPATGVGETWNIAALVATLPAGVKPI